MRILIVDPYYSEVLGALYASRPGLSGAGYRAQWQELMWLSFGTSDAYSHYLRELGHEADEVVPNCPPLQRAWAREHGLNASRLPWRLAAPRILLAQARAFQPDVIYIQSVGAYRPAVLRALRRRTRLLVGQIASAVPERERLRCYDLVLTSFPHFVSRFRMEGLQASLLRIGFDPRILDRLDDSPRHDVVFVGQLGGSHHEAGNAVVEEAARNLGIDVWGPGIEDWPLDSPFRRRHHGTAWGVDMFRILAGAHIALNRHIDAAEGHANNMRLFEATGVGTMLLTDDRLDLDLLFEPDREVVAYRDAAELVEKARWYLEHDSERLGVARAGRERTMRDHTYAVRMCELEVILEEALATPRPG